MTLTQSERASKLATLVRSEGFADVEAMLGAAVLDSVAPGICLACDGTTDTIEPDQEHGWCAHCGANRVVSCLILAGII